MDRLKNKRTIARSAIIPHRGQIFLDLWDRWGTSRIKQGGFAGSGYCPPPALSSVANGLKSTLLRSPILFPSSGL